MTEKQRKYLFARAEDKEKRILIWILDDGSILDDGLMMILKNKDKCKNNSISFGVSLKYFLVCSSQVPAHLCLTINNT